MLGSSLFSWRSSMAAAAASIARQTGTLAAASDPDSICPCRSLSRTSNSFISAMAHSPRRYVDRRPHVK